MDRLFYLVFYWTFYAAFWLLGKALRFTFDLTLYLLTLGFYKMKNRQKDTGEPTFPLDKRFEHMHIVANTGHGKTQLLQWLIYEDLLYLKEGKGSIVVIDSQGDLINNIMKLGIVRDISDRLILIDPHDIEHPPALNLFDFGLDRLNQYNAVERQNLYNSAVALYEYLFGALLGAELTARQGMIFRYLARLMMTVEGANIKTFMMFIREPETTRMYYARLDETTRDFFETEFSSRIYDDTRAQILTRLWRVLADDTIANMFSSEKNAINLFEAMNRGSLILINTAKDLLKREGCEIFGRFFISLIAQAIQERSVIPQEKRRATFVYIDEAQDYFDDSIEEMLATARKFKVGLILSHQTLSQLDSRLRSAVMANTSIKLIGGVSAEDAKVFAAELQCEPSWITVVKKEVEKKLTQFVCYIRNGPPTTILGVPLLRMEESPQMTSEEREQIILENRRRYGQALQTTIREATRQRPAIDLSEPDMI